MLLCYTGTCFSVVFRIEQGSPSKLCISGVHFCTEKSADWKTQVKKDSRSLRNFVLFQRSPPTVSGWDNQYHLQYLDTHDAGHHVMWQYLKYAFGPIIHMEHNLVSSEALRMNSRIISHFHVFFWVMTPCSLVSGYQHFRGKHCLHLQGISEV
jgi:hypothetical protein